MGTYRIEYTFDIADGDLKDLTMQDAVAQGAAFPELSEEQKMGLVSSALSLPPRMMVLNIVGRHISMLGPVIDGRVRASTPGLQIVHLADPDAPPLPYPEQPA